MTKSEFIDIQENVEKHLKEINKEAVTHGLQVCADATRQTAQIEQCLIKLALTLGFDELPF